MIDIPRVNITDEAAAVVKHLREKNGEIAGCDFYMATDQFEFWQHTELTIDVTPGRGASFSLEIPLGVRFVTKSRIFTHEETQHLTETRAGDVVI